VRDRDTVDDLDGVYARWFEASGAAVVLTRPDFYVYGTASRLEGTKALVQQLRAAEPFGA
jgi:hypothetical protein